MRRVPGLLRVQLPVSLKLYPEQGDPQLKTSLRERIGGFHGEQVADQCLRVLRAGPDQAEPGTTLERLHCGLELLLRRAIDREAAGRHAAVLAAIPGVLHVLEHSRDSVHHNDLSG